MMTLRNGQPYTYDANGNTLTGGGRTNVWDSQNRLYSCAYGGNTNAFTYGSDGLRRTSVTNGTQTDFALDGQTVVREMRDVNSDGLLESIATYFNGMYKRDDTNGTLRWYIYDGLGSVLAEVDPSGNVTAGRKYDVYGLVRSGQAGISKHKFVGQLGHPSEDETGLIYMRARYMDPVLGRFISEDSVRDGDNWFVYCSNNPISRFDANGNTEATLGGCLVSGLISGVLNAIIGAIFKQDIWQSFLVGFGAGFGGGVSMFMGGTAGAMLSAWCAALNTDGNGAAILFAFFSGAAGGMIGSLNGPDSGIIMDNLLYWFIEGESSVWLTGTSAYASQF